jgi:uncharacterized protein (TIGR03086 family)
MLTSAASGSPDFGVYGNDNVGSNARASFDDAAAGLRDAWRQPGALDTLKNTSFGPVSGDIWGPLAVMELVQHGWDIARATGQKAQFDDELSTIGLDAAKQFPPDQMRNPQAFGPEVQAPAGAPAHDRLAAFLGRTP